MDYCHRQDGELELFPGARALAQPAFPSEAAYQQFRDEFSTTMGPAIRDSNRRHALSELDARRPWVD
ncbi:hypothetical protein EXS73_03655 [Candidatus Pacearchaeota archaeon]|nr:hypothetical protein [Candidatus Pacearchaeota archaeon]